MSHCTHLNDLSRLQPPKLSQSVHREECTQCFENQDSPQGVDICLLCFNGGCLDDKRHHARTHVQRTGHTFVLNVRRKPKPSARRAEEEEPPAKMTKLSIVEEREEDKYDHTTTLKCWACDPVRGAELHDVPQEKALTEGVMQSMSSARQSEVKAWEEELMPCEHTFLLEQLTPGPMPASGLAHCNYCELTSNLWLCLTCGSLGCGRAQFGGVGGNGHGLSHFEATSHPVSVKLGTITPEGGADIYCYACNDARLDLELAMHLAAFGINVSTQTKTEKSMTELQIEHNLKFDFSLTAEDGSALEPVFGPGLTGLANLGNSCYMSSILQTLFALPAFRTRYYHASAEDHWLTCPESLPAECVECQMLKVGDGLLSGRYAVPASYIPVVTSPADGQAKEHVHGAPITFQAGVKPGGFKALVGRGHAEFAGMRQQDAEEFFGWLLTVLRRHAKKMSGADPQPTEVFAFGLEQRLECGDCKRVRYRVDNVDTVSLAVPAKEKQNIAAEGEKKWEEVRLGEMLKTLTSTETIEYACPACGKGVFANKRTRFASFPDVLVVHAKKFQLVNWVPTKLDIPVVLPTDDVLTLDAYLGRGLQPGETELPDTDAPSSASGSSAPPPVDAAALAQLEGMGFPTVRCEKALRATTGGAEAAMEWLFAHMDDPDIDEPIVANPGSGVSQPNEEQISMLAEMGFTPAQARKALRETSGNAERAVEWLFSHPDDNGEDAAPAATASAPEPAKVPGSTTLPARYVLRAFVSHKGPSVHSGHYVAHIRTPEGWVLFNDEKVVRADDASVDALKQLAYLYFFERVQA